MTQSLFPEAPTESAPASSVAAATPQAHGRPWVRLVLEVVLISAGVFLGLAGDQWRENASHRDLAKASLRRFRAEIAANREKVAAVRDYRTTTLVQLRAYLAADHAVRNTANVTLSGLRSVHFEETAWDLAIATQSLAYIEPDLAADVSRIYNRQERIGELNRGIFQAMYLLPKQDNFDGLASAVETYFADLSTWEPELATMYDAILPRIDRALGGAAQAPVTAK
jgi:hypothetical protein